MYILGISAFYHDSAASLIKDGKVIAAAEEERFSRIKHDNSFPYKAIDFCLREERITIKDIKFVAYYEKPLLKFERIFQTFIETYPFSLQPFLKSMPEWLDQKIKIEWLIRKRIGFNGIIYFIPHHLSHAASAFYPSPFRSSAILTIDGVGEYQTSGLWSGKNNIIYSLKSVNFPNSIGLFYSTFTAFLGFRVNNDEYKVMGLAAYGKPKYVDKIHKIINIAEDGSFKLDLSYFSFRQDFKMWSKKFEKLFGKPKNPKEKFSQEHKDLAASLQTVTEEVYFKMLNHLHYLTNSKNLCISGGVALNALANGKIFSNTRFRKVYVFGPAGDSGASLGAALFTYCYILGNSKRTKINSLNFGTEYDEQEIENELKMANLKYHKFISENDLTQKVAKWLYQGKIVGWFQGKMELGPRALGARSILARPNPRQMKKRVNDIKEREQFRPFAGSVLSEKVQELFEILPKTYISPFMVFCFPVKKKEQKNLAAIVHKDETCRIQLVKEEDGLYYKLIKSFYRLSGIPCILNTSFNLAGEPIVESPKQAIEDFKKTKMDVLVLGNFWVSKIYRQGRNPSLLR